MAVGVGSLFWAVGARPEYGDLAARLTFLHDQFFGDRYACDSGSTGNRQVVGVWTIIACTLCMSSLLVFFYWWSLLPHIDPHALVGRTYRNIKAGLLDVVMSAPCCWYGTAVLAVSTPHVFTLVVLVAARNVRASDG